MKIIMIGVNIISTPISKLKGRYKIFILVKNMKQKIKISNELKN